MGGRPPVLALPVPNGSHGATLIGNPLRTSRSWGWSPRRSWGLSPLHAAPSAEGSTNVASFYRHFFSFLSCLRRAKRWRGLLLSCPGRTPRSHTHAVRCGFPAGGAHRPPHPNPLKIRESPVFQHMHETAGSSRVLSDPHGSSQILSDPFGSSQILSDPRRSSPILLGPL